MAHLSNDPTCFVLVGLPARGKSYISKKLARYFNWIGVHTKTFNAGDYRRKIYGAEDCKHDFFDPANASGNEARKKCVDHALTDVESFFNGGGQVAILDAANSTIERRTHVHNRCKNAGIKTFFIESICDDPEVIHENIIQVKLTSPDYVNCSEEEAVADFLERIRHYKEQYQTVDVVTEKHLSFIKIINVGEKFFVHLISGYLQTRAIYFLMNVNVARRSIYLTRHGESMLNVSGRMGGDSELSPRGREYSIKLAEFIKSQDIANLNVWTSTLKRTIETAIPIEAPYRERWSALDELYAGICDNMTYEEVQQQYPEEFALRDQDKYCYRYPRGESYEDVVNRLEPVIMEFERQQNVLAVCHQAVMRCLLAYFLDDTNSKQLPYINVPLHTVFKLTPLAYGWHVEKFELDVPCVNTYRVKPTNVEVTRSPEQALSTIPQHAETPNGSDWNIDRCSSRYKHIRKYMIMQQ